MKKIDLCDHLYTVGWAIITFGFFGGLVCLISNCQHPHKNDSESTIISLFAIILSILFAIYIEKTFDKVKQKEYRKSEHWSIIDQEIKEALRFNPLSEIKNKFDNDRP